jgi:hypothetical protein
MKKQVDEGRFDYWRSLFVHLVTYHKVVYARSITMKAGKFTYNNKKCIHEANASFRNSTGIRGNETVKTGHLEICTWEENPKLNPGLQRRKTADDPFENWVPLIAYLEQRRDVKFINSITMKEGSFTVIFEKY